MGAGPLFLVTTVLGFAEDNRVFTEKVRRLVE